MPSIHLFLVPKTQPHQNRKSLSCVKCTNSAVPEDTPDYSFWSNGCAGGSIALCQDKWQSGCGGAVCVGELVWWAVHFLSSLFVLTASQSKWCSSAALDSEWGHREVYFSLESHTIQKNNLIVIKKKKIKQTKVSLSKQGSSPSWAKRNIGKISFLGTTKIIQSSTSGGMKAFVGNRKYWYSWETENTDTQVLAIIDNSGFRGHKIFGKKENRLEEKALQEKRWAQREPRRKKSKAYRRGRDTVKYQEGWEKKEMKTSEVKEAEKKWTKTVRDGKHQRAWGAGSQAGVVQG